MSMRRRKAIESIACKALKPCANLMGWHLFVTQ